MPERDRLMAAGLCAVTVAWALALALMGSTEALLFMAPATLLMVPLLLGRYFAEDILTALAALRRPPARPASDPMPDIHRAPTTIRRGGELIAAFLAERPPPHPLLT